MIDKNVYSNVDYCQTVLDWHKACKKQCNGIYASPDRIVMDQHMLTRRVQKKTALCIAEPECAMHVTIRIFRPAYIMCTDTSHTHIYVADTVTVDERVRPYELTSEMFV